MTEIMQTRRVYPFPIPIIQRPTWVGGLCDDHGGSLGVGKRENVDVSFISLWELARATYRALHVAIDAAIALLAVGMNQLIIPGAR